MHYYQRNVGDYIRDTAHLSLLEHGIYNRLIDIYYLSEKPLLLDVGALARQIGARSKEERDALELVLADFFAATEQGFAHRRCDKELARIYGKSDAARKAAALRWQGERNASGKHSDSKSNADEKHLESGRNANAYESDANALQAHSDGNASGMLPINPVTQSTTTTSTTPARDEKPIRVGNFDPKPPRPEIPPPELLCQVPGFDPTAFALQLRQGGVKLPDDEALEVEWARFRFSVADGPPDEPRMWIKRFLKSLVYLQRSGQLGKTSGGNNATRKHKTTADVLEQLRREADALESRACAGG